MPTSSIFHNVVIDTPEKAERFINALEESYKDITERGLGQIPPNPCRYVRDPEEIRQIVQKIKSRHTEEK